VHGGQIWANTEQIKYLLDALATAPSMHVVNAKGEGVLTSREDQVVSLVADGISNREIAGQLSIKENTVKKSLLRIYDKLGVSNRVELVLYALTHRDRYSQGAAANYPPTHAVVHSISAEKGDFVGMVAEGALKTN
jgi:DNA-binding NarL/FixJ family response regulator